MDDGVLKGKHIRLEPLDLSHVAGLTKAAASDPSLFKWTFVPQGTEAVTKYINAAIGARDAGKAIPFAIVGMADGMVKGSTRYWNLEYWEWPENHPLHGKNDPDVCEIGHTWLTASAIKTAANTEAKLLLLTNAFENWQALRVCFRTDARNERSRAAIERIGGKFEGIIRAERMGADFTVRDSCRYSIIASEWPDVRDRLVERLEMYQSQPVQMSTPEDNAL